MDMNVKREALRRSALKSRSWVYATAAIACLGSTPVAARSELHPYLEVGQVLTADLNDQDVLTYSTISLGVDASAKTQRSEVQLNYRYDRYIGWGDALDNRATHTGIGRVRTTLIPDTLSVEGGLLATRSRQDFKGAALRNGAIDGGNSSQLFAGYLSPRFERQFGALDFGASYRASFAHASQPDLARFSGEELGLLPFRLSVAHAVEAHVGMREGSLPFGWMISSGIGQDRQTVLSGRFTQAQVRLDVTLPISSTMALVGGVGKQWARASQRDALVDAEGNALKDRHGSPITDSASPRRLVYDFSGFYGDASLLWKPSSRTRLELRAGRRFGSTSFTGSFDWQARPDAALQLSVFDAEETLGQELARGLDGVPTSYWTGGDGALLTGLGCSFGSKGGGQCLNGTLSGMNGVFYRSRGATLVWSQSHGRWGYGLGLGVNRRDFLGLGSLIPDQRSGFGNASLTYQASRATQLGTDLVVSIYDQGVSGEPIITTETWTVTAAHEFARNLSGRALIGLTAVQGAVSDNTYGTARASLRYAF